MGHRFPLPKNMNENGQFVKNIILGILTAILGIVCTGGTMWADAMYKKVEFMAENQAESNERITKLETQFTYISQSLNEIKEMVKYGQNGNRSRRP